MKAFVKKKMTEENDIHRKSALSSKFFDSIYFSDKEAAGKATQEENQGRTK